jgi:hypothetical protein
MTDRAPSTPPRDVAGDDGGQSGTRPRQSVEPPRGPGEITQPFLLEKKSGSERPPPPTEPVAERAERPSEVARNEARADVAKMARRVGVILLANSTLYAGIAASGALRYYRDHGAIPEVVLSIVAGGLALWGALAGHHLWRAGAGGSDGGHELAGAFSNLRSIFVLKGTGLFLFLALACFAFSAVFSLAALL